MTTLTEALTYKGFDKDTGKFVFSYITDDNKEEILELNATDFATNPASEFNWDYWTMSLKESEFNNYIKQLDFLDLEISDYPCVTLAGFEVFWVGGKSIDNTVQKFQGTGKISQDVTKTFTGMCLRSKTEEDICVFITSQVVFVKNTPPLWYLDKTLILKYLTVHDQ